MTAYREMEGIAPLILPYAIFEYYIQPLFATNEEMRILIF